uniref:ABC transporter domain-containing protein n=1 Tax=viral metagenome TaxID=1070528 RepID=A0A6C0DRS4_9ZZZZ
MNILSYLFSTFFTEQKYSTIALVLLSFLINIFQINGMSLISAKLIQFIEKKDSENAWEYLRYFILVTAFALFVLNVYRMLQNKVLTKLRQWLRHQLLKYVLMINREELDEINFTTLSSPINRMASSGFGLFYNVVNSVLPNVTLLIIITGYFFLKNPVFGIFFLLCNLLTIGYIYYNWNYLVGLRDDYEIYFNNSESKIIDILNNLDKIIHRGNSENEMNEFAEITEIGIKRGADYYEAVNYTNFVCNIIIFIIVSLAISYLIHLYFQKQITVTMFIAIFTVLLLYKERFSSTIQSFPDFMDFISRANFILDLFDKMKIDYKHVDDTVYNPVDIPFDIVKFENVSFKYEQSDKMLFENLNITVKLENKIIGITGLSGNGKSTFAKLLLKLYKPQSGNIFIDGVNIKDIDGDYIRRNIAYVNQNSKLFDKTVVENIFYGCGDREHCDKYLQIIMKYPKIRDLFKNIDIQNKSAGLLGENLSGGQRQVVNFIGGLVLPSKILILDEPTNALDNDLKMEIIQLIRDFKVYKKCIFVISHDKDVFAIYDKRIEI